MRLRLRSVLVVPALFALAAACGDSRSTPIDDEARDAISPVETRDATTAQGVTVAPTDASSHRGARTAKASTKAAEAPVPAALQMAVLRQRQTAPGYDFVPSASGALASHTGAATEGVVVAATADGVRLSTAGLAPSDDTALGVETLSVGRAGSRASTHVLDKHADGQELVLVRDDGVEERFLAGPLGLEQSYRINHAPAGTGAVIITVAFDGLAPAEVDGHTDRVVLNDAAGRVRGGYRDLVVVDASSREVPAHMSVQGGNVELVIDDTDARYPLAVDPVVWTLQQELTALDDGAGDSFGFSVSVSGPLAFVGAPNHSVAGKAGAGAAYVFLQTGTVWALQQELAAGDAAAGDEFGFSVSVNGALAVVGAPAHAVAGKAGAGAAYVFVQSGVVWTLQAELTAGDAAAVDGFGTSVSMGTASVIVGSPDHSVAGKTQAGAAYVFAQSGTTWSQQAELTAGDAAAFDNFGTSVSISATNSATNAVVGAPFHTVGAKAEAGAAYAFVESGITWTQQAELTAGDGAAFDGFGTSVSVSGTTALVGAPDHTTNAHSEAGAAYVFAQTGTAWPEQQELTASDAALGDLFGYSVSVSGTNAVVGAYQHDVTATVSAGAAYLFFQVCPAWVQTTELTASDKAASDFFGFSVAVSATTAMVGAYQHDVGGAVSAGSAYAYGAVVGNAACCISGFTFPAGATNPADGCEACTPTLSTTNWSTEPSGTTCNDGNACTQTDTCQAGVCTGSNPVTCTPIDPCHTSACDPATGACSNIALANGAACNDGNACTQTDTCQAGVCTGTNPVTCSPLDQCHAAGTCSAVTGVCSNPAANDGTSCNDGNGCTQTDTCQAGMCAGSNPVTCAPLDQCHATGTCNPASGTCSNPADPDGTPCNDANACTQVDACQAGACVGANPVVCTASDQCHSSGVCDPLAGVCSNPADPDGTMCDDGNACTQTDSCQVGVCGGTPVVCVAQDECHLAGTCATGTGACSNPAQPDGTLCSIGTCMAGTCTPKATMDAGMDAAAVDGGQADGATDASPKDAATDSRDGGTTSDGSADANPLDAARDGSEADAQDASERDASPRDGEAPDAREPHDASHHPDAREHHDAEAPDAAEASSVTPSGGGFSCSVSEAPHRTDSRGLVLGLAALAFVGARRRKTSRARRAHRVGA